MFSYEILFKICTVFMYYFLNKRKRFRIVEVKHTAEYTLLPVPLCHQSLPSFRKPLSTFRRATPVMLTARAPSESGGTGFTSSAEDEMRTSHSPATTQSAVDHAPPAWCSSTRWPVPCPTQATRQVQSARRPRRRRACGPQQASSSGKKGCEDCASLGEVRDRTAE